MKVVTGRDPLVKFEEQLRKPCATEVSVLTLADGSKRLSVRRVVGRYCRGGILFRADEVKALKESLEQLDLSNWDNITVEE